MAKLGEYSQNIQELLTKYSHYKPSYGGVEIELIFDTQRNHYQIMSVGWNNQKRVYGTIIHL
jgi:hypothetical protein